MEIVGENARRSADLRNPRTAAVPSPQRRIVNLRTTRAVIDTLAQRADDNVYFIGDEYGPGRIHLDTTRRPAALLH